MVVSTLDASQAAASMPRMPSLPHLTRRAFAARAVVCAWSARALVPTAAVASRTARAQDYPVRPARVIVPFAAGGPADVYGRVLAQRLQEALGQPFVVDDRPGAGSLIGTDLVAKSAPDGYTLLLMSNTHTVNESLFASKPYQLMRDFAPITPINSSDLVLVGRTGLEARTLAELLRQARAKPGSLTYASSGPGTPYHMAGELFKAMAGVSIVHIPYRGSSGARSDVLGGQVDLMFDAIPTMAEHVRAGKVKAFGTTGSARSPVMPDVPTIAEAGVPGYEAVIWLGLMAPKGTPPAIVNRLHDEVARIVSSPEIAKAWIAQGATPMSMSVDDFGRYLAQDIDKWARIVKISGAKPDQ
jgi:tripartite-type tricarboxylate transporter receptor subunit TctC